MATKEQCEFFKSLYDEENSRHGILENRAKLYITIISLYLGAIAFKIPDIAPLSQQLKVHPLVFYLVIIVFLAALIAAIVAIKIRSYAAVCDPIEVILNFESAPQSNEEFFDRRIVEYAVATKVNRQVNNRVATTLQSAVWMLFVGVVVHMGTFVLALKA